MGFTRTHAHVDLWAFDAGDDDYDVDDEKRNESLANISEFP